LRENDAAFGNAITRRCLARDSRSHCLHLAARIGPIRRWRFS
jgi:hypothetical protein